MAFLGIVALMHALGRDADASFGDVLPVDDDHGGRLVALLGAAILLTIGFGLVRNKRLAWCLAVFIFATALLAQATMLHHPIAAMIAGALITALLADARRYGVRATPTSGVLVIATIGSILLVAVVRVILEAGGGLPGPTAAVTWLASGLGAGLGVDDVVTRATGSSTNLAAAGALLVLPGRFLVMLVALATLAPARLRPMGPLAEQRARRLLDRYGQGALLPFQLGSGVSLHLATDGNAVVAYGNAGRASIILGDPVGPRDAWAAEVVEFVGEARQNDRIVAVYQATHAAIPVLHAAGFSRAYRIGQEAVIDLETFDLAGSSRANLRHTVTRFRRGGGTVEWFERGMEEPEFDALGPKLADIDRTWRNRAGPQLGFTVGEFHLEDLRSIPVAIAMATPDEPVAFATFRPTGRDQGFVLELIRRRPDAIPGAVEACVAFAAERMRRHGATRLSLGLAPLHGLRAVGGPVEERLLRVGGNAVKAWYDIDGLAFFKRKFDPRWEPRYVAAVHRRDAIPVAIALLRLHLGGRGSLSHELRGIADGVRRSRPH